MEAKAVVLMGATVGKAVSSEVDLSVAQALISKMIGSTLMVVSDERWQEIMDAGVKPCGKPGCDCHEMGALLFPVLDKVRGWYDAHHPDMKMFREEDNGSRRW